MSRIPASGAMTWNDIQNSFGGSNPVAITEYYTGGSFVTPSDLNANIPTSGQIEATDFRGADGFSGTTGSFTAGSTGGKSPEFGWDDNRSIGSNLGTAMSTGQGIKCNFAKMYTGLGLLVYGSLTTSPCTVTTTNLQARLISGSGANTWSAQQAGPGTAANTVDATSSFGGGTGTIAQYALAPMTSSISSGSTYNFTIS